MRLDMPGNGPRGPIEIEFIEEPTVQTATTARPFVLRVLRAAVAATLLVGVLFVGALLGVSSVTAPSLLPVPAPAAASTILP